MHHFGNAMRLFAENIALLVPLVFLFWLPANLALNYQAFYFPADNPSSDIHLANLVSAFVSPPVTAATLLIAAASMRGERISFLDALGGGCRYWLPLIGLNFVVGLVVIIGLIALIIPGIILALRFGVAAQCVVLEDTKVMASLDRSAKLMDGYKLTAMGLATLGFIIVMAASLAMYFICESVVETPVTAVVCYGIVDTVIDVIALVITLTFFSIYWEAADRQNEAFDATDGEQLTAQEAADVERARQLDLGEDHNPFRPPRF